MLIALSLQHTITPQPLYNTLDGVHNTNNRVISKQKCVDYIEKMTIYGHFFNIICTFLGCIFKPCYNQTVLYPNRVITNRVLKSLKCMLFSRFHAQSCFIRCCKLFNPKGVKGGSIQKREGVAFHI